MRVTNLTKVVTTILVKLNIIGTSEREKVLQQQLRGIVTIIKRCSSSQKAYSIR